MPGLDPAISGTGSVKPGFQVGEDRVERGAKRDQKTVGPLAIAFAADIAFPETRSDAAQVTAVAANVAAVAQILRSCAGIAVEAPEHLRDVAVDAMEDAR